MHQHILWVSDITYLKVGNSWHYLSVFIDLFSRSVVGWNLSDSLNRYSVMKALNKAIIHSRLTKSLMIHSDRGIQYASKDFRNILDKHGFVQNMSRKGDCWDNAVAESFFHTLKIQLLHHVHFQTFEKTERRLFKYIEMYYNLRRKHSANGWKTPAHCEQEWYNLKNVAYRELAPYLEITLQQFIKPEDMKYKVDLSKYPSFGEGYKRAGDHGK